MAPITVQVATLRRLILRGRELRINVTHTAAKAGVSRRWPYHFLVGTGDSLNSNIVSATVAWEEAVAKAEAALPKKPKPRKAASVRQRPPAKVTKAKARRR